MPPKQRDTTEVFLMPRWYPKAIKFGSSKPLRYTKHTERGSSNAFGMPSIPKGVHRFPLGMLDISKGVPRFPFGTQLVNISTQKTSRGTQRVRSVLAWVLFGYTLAKKTHSSMPPPNTLPYKLALSVSLCYSLGKHPDSKNLPRNTKCTVRVHLNTFWVHFG